MNQWSGEPIAFSKIAKGGPGDQLKDWQRAEAEVVGPLACGFVTLDNKISVNTDVSVFDEGLIEVCAEPGRLTSAAAFRADKKEAEPKRHGSGTACCS